jgi:uncharacterized protein (DUF2235 family)
MAPRQIILCCDGTNNNLSGGLKDTNVVKLLRLIESDHQNQVLYYDPGVGNPGELPGATWTDTLARRRERLSGLAFGGGVYENVQEAYRFLMHNYCKGDQIYFFGFSRGAFTARSIAGLVNQFGILRPQMESMLPTLLHVYFGNRRDKEKYRRITEEIRQSFCAEENRSVPIWFVGVWDTVASVGAPPFSARMTAIPTIKGKRFVHVRQALALDEHRAPFKPRPYIDDNSPVNSSGEPHGLDFDNAVVSDAHQTMRQLWFRGSHCDTGGGYTLAQSAISDDALLWLSQQAVECGLRLSFANRHLLSESDIAEAGNFLDMKAEHPTLTIHSQTYSNCLWAIAGLQVRDSSSVKVDGHGTIAVRAEEHESVSRLRVSFPKDTDWVRPRPKMLLCISIVLTLAVMLGLGAIHCGMGLGDFLNKIFLEPNFFGNLLSANAQFYAWQLFPWNGSSTLRSWGGSHFPRTTLSVDLLLIALYAYILAWFSVRSFAKLAGFNRVNTPNRVWLNRLGYALPVMIVADLSENIFTFVLVSLSTMRLCCAEAHFGLLWAQIVGVLMSGSALVKGLSFLAVLSLIGWGLAARRA